MQRYKPASLDKVRTQLGRSRGWTIEDEEKRELFLLKRKYHWMQRYTEFASINVNKLLVNSLPPLSPINSADSLANVVRVCQAVFGKVDRFFLMVVSIVVTKSINGNFVKRVHFPFQVAIPDVLQAAQDADVLVFVIPHQFIKTICAPLVGKLKSTAVGISLIKGFDIAEGGGIALISHIIHKVVNIPMSVLMGANLAGEVADEKFCETTIGCRDIEVGRMYRDLIQTDYFRVVVVDDVEAVEVCGALKNIVATGAGFIDGLGFGDNTKAAVIRLGLMEMIKFCEVFYAGSKLGTFFESCGVADLITTCYGGRNRRVAEAFVKTGKSIEELEKEMLNGQKLQGPQTAAEVNYMLKNKDMEDRFPLFTSIHRVCLGEIPPSGMIDCIRNHPEHMCSFDKQHTAV
ncbi:glycerol-3-phosphate dehydrogenase [NAD(+)], cytoplasmic-like [Palaemon carinicauda]|uniref:glycerol-3-phosphate dehydrogenase [NAD(+)], cytoplasmic-like n=1 Tax=Palaemon carinicauda TaxID=392227 RepID=UPI0035B64B5F